MRPTLLSTSFALLALLASISAAPINPASSSSSDESLVQRAELEDRSKTRAAVITYYTGQQLKNPACGGPTPTKNSMVAAVMDGGMYECGDQIKIKHQNKQISVKVVDFCAGCSSSAIDLTSGAFSRLANLQQGSIKGAQAWVS